MPEYPFPQPMPAEARPYRVVAEFREISTPDGKVWQFVSPSAEMVDHAWQQRERFQQLSNGASRFEVVWQDQASEVVVSHDPSLPAP